MHLVVVSGIEVEQLLFNVVEGQQVVRKGPWNIERSVCLCLVLTFNKLGQRNVTKLHALHLVNFAIDEKKILRYVDHTKGLLKYLIHVDVNIAKPDFSLILISNYFHSVHNELTKVEI